MKLKDFMKLLSGFDGELNVELAASIYEDAVLHIKDSNGKIIKEIWDCDLEGVKE